MTTAELDSLLEAFLAAKAAGQEELWRETHPAAPDGPTVLILWLKTKGLLGRDALLYAFEAVDKGCALRMAIYAAIAAHPVWDRYCGALDEAFHAAPGEAIRAAIACYRNPTVENCRAARNACGAVHASAAAASTCAAAYSAAYAAFHAAAADAAAIRSAAFAASAAANAAYRARIALGDAEKVVSAIIAAIADHYEGRPLVIP